MCMKEVVVVDDVIQTQTKSANLLPKMRPGKSKLELPHGQSQGQGARKSNTKFAASLRKSGRPGAV